LLSEPASQGGSNPACNQYFDYIAKIQKYPEITKYFRKKNTQKSTFFRPGKATLRPPPEKGRLSPNNEPLCPITAGYYHLYKLK
jgi:hypothetical protein